MVPKRSEYEVVIVGAGIAGCSLACFLADCGIGDVLVVEQETHPAYHSTGRSAAVLVELEEDPTLRALIIQGGAFLRRPPDGFSEHPLLVQSGAMVALDPERWEATCRAAAELERQGVRIELLSAAAACDRVPVLAGRAFAGAALLPEDGGIDVHELLSSYLRRARASGVELCGGLAVTALLRERGRCAGVVTATGPIRARWVVNAAGGWAATVGRMAEASPIPVVPYRRCAAIFAAAGSLDTTGWPLVWSDWHRVYFRPESGQLLFSPMDEQQMEPRDAQPDDLTIAEGFTRLERLAPDLSPASVARRWAGMRTFAPDRIPLVGEDPGRPGFFWLAGQGGCGIETSPAIGAIAADLIACGKTERFDARLLSPGRRFAAS